MELTEGVGESSSPPRSFGSISNSDSKTDVYNWLVKSGNADALANPEFRQQLAAHFNRLPPSYILDVNMDRVEAVVVHMKLLEQAKDPANRPAFCVQFLKTNADCDEDQLISTPSALRSSLEVNNGGHVGSNSRNGDLKHDFELYSNIEDLNLDMRQSSGEMERRLGAPSHIHEVIFSTVDKPKLLSQLSALLSDIGLNIREAHVFSTTDGYSLDVFTVDGWEVQDTDSLQKALAQAIVDSEDSWSISSRTQALVVETKPRNWEIDRRLLKIGDRIAAGSGGDLYRGLYLDQDVAIKILRYEHLTEALEVEFAQEVTILREVQHKNVVRFIGACTKSPDLCIVTVMVADFGVARFLNQEGVMTAETGTYRWMAPEVINHLPYDQKADVFGFAIVLWELITVKVPYDDMTPLQAALGVRQGLRPELPENAHPKLLNLMQRCWNDNPCSQPPFSAIRVELEELLQEIE